MRVLVPFDAAEPKTRLEPLLDADERYDLALVMLESVLATIEQAGHEPSVLSTATIDCSAPVTVAEKPLTPTVNAALTESSLPVSVVMADLPLLREGALERLFAASADIVIAPGIGGGTNALVVDAPEFHVDYHGVSVADHRRIARNCGATVDSVDSFRLAVDVDEPADLPEVLLHDEGPVARWLRERGFEIGAEQGRTTITRET